MNRKLSLIILISLLFTMSAIAFSQEIPQGISNNSYHTESLRFKKLAEETYASGDYEASAGFAQEAIRFSNLSDEYVSTKLIGEAERLKILAERNHFAERFPNNYNEGVKQYESAVESHSIEAWNNSITSAINAIETFGVFEGRPPAAAVTGTTASGLPRQYTVRTWVVERDCFWNIASYPWVYGDPWRWRVLYEANKSKLPDPNNPDLMEPGMILEIPNLSDESRQGMWRPQ